MNEQQDIEFKSQWRETVLKTAFTFANNKFSKLQIKERGVMVNE